MKKLLFSKLFNKKWMLLTSMFSLSFSIFSLSIFITNISHYHEAEAVEEGVRSNQYFVFGFNLQQSGKSGSYRFSFDVTTNQGKQAGNIYANDNFYMIFKNNTNSVTVFQSFSEIGTPSSGGYTYSGTIHYVYYIKAPLVNKKEALFTSVECHIFLGTTSVGGKTYFVTANPIIDLTQNKSPEILLFHISRNTYTYSNLHLYDFYGEYFLRMCPCSGRGDASDRQNTSTSWGMMINEKILNSTKLPTEIKRYMSNYSTVDSSTFSLAMERYDYIMFYKRYGYTDFLNRSTVGNARYNMKDNPSMSFYMKEEDISDYVVIICSVIALLSIATLSILIIKKYISTHRQE